MVGFASNFPRINPSTIAEPVETLIFLGNRTSGIGLPQLVRTFLERINQDGAVSYLSVDLSVLRCRIGKQLSATNLREQNARARIRMFEPKKGGDECFSPFGVPIFVSL